jgi:putative acetyltransferase
MSVTVRPGRPDEPAGRALLRESQAYLDARYPPEDNHFLSIEELCAPHVRFFIAEAGGRPCGCGALAVTGDWGEVKSLYVDPAARGAGAGAALMARIEAEARALGLGAMRLETGDDLYPAHRLYRRHGFVTCGPFGAYAEGPHSVFMEKRLD